MANLIFNGYADEPVASAFDGDESLIIISATATKVVGRNPATNFTSEFVGTDLVFNTQTGTYSGTLSSVTIKEPGGQISFQISGVSWPLVQFVAGINQILDDGAQTPIFDALLNMQPLNYSAAGSDRGSVSTLNWLDQPQTLQGSAFEDTLQGGDANDIINPGTSDDGEVILGSGGSDTIILSDVLPTNWVLLGYKLVSDLGSPIIATINGTTNTAQIQKVGLGTDTIVDINKVLLGDGLDLDGTTLNDVFNLRPAGGYIGISPGPGADTVNIDLGAGGTVRLDYTWNFGATTNTTGITANLATGLISNDRFGTQDQINITDGSGQLELRATDYNDVITGSDRNERFILRSGTDTLDAGGGWDVLRYDRSGISQGIVADMLEGIIRGKWSGTTFTHTVSNVEEVRGSVYGDVMRTAETGSLLDGLGGNDSLYGGLGSDTLYAGDGNDYINPGGNNGLSADEIFLGTGTDTIDFGSPELGAFRIDASDLSSTTAAGAQFTINSPANTGSITAPNGAGVTTLLEVGNALRPDAALAHYGLTGQEDNPQHLALSGMDAKNNSYDITLQTGDMLTMLGLSGIDSYSIGGDGGGARLLFGNDTPNADVSTLATQGAVINLATGVIANDGFGNAETMTHSGAVQLGVRGTSFGDSMIGDAGDNDFSPLGGNDTIAGGAGFDTVSYDHEMTTAGVKVNLTTGAASGAWNGVTFAQAFASIEAVVGSAHTDILIGNSTSNRLVGMDGNDKLYGDGYRAAYDLPEARTVYRLYQATLDRAPDTTGQANWTQRLVEGTHSLQQVAAGFVNSPEFQNTYGSLTNSGFVAQLYLNVLDRAADTAGLANWTARLDGGMTKPEVVIGFSQSPEFSTATNAAANKFTLEHNPATWSDDVFRLYQATLDRAPDLTGFTNWSGRLADGMALQTVISGFVNSPEFQNTYGNLTNSGFVEQLYQNVLDRPSDANGLANWTARMDGGMTKSEVVQGFAQSAEFIAATKADLTDWIQAQGINDTLIGGGGTNQLWGGVLADAFVFDASDAGTNTVMDFEAWDYLRFTGFGYATEAQALSHMTQSGANVVFEDQGTSVTIMATQLAAIHDSTILL